MEYTNKDKKPDSQDLAQYWRQELEASGKAEKEYRDTAKMLLDKYASESKQGTEFNILWANTEVLKPAVYSNKPTPDVRRRYTIKKNEQQQNHLQDTSSLYRYSEQVVRDTAIGMERALKYQIEHKSFDESVINLRDDMLITGRGVAKVEYEPNIVKRKETITIIDPETGDTTQEEQEIEEFADQKVELVWYPYDRFRISLANSWRDVRWVAFMHTPDKDEGVEKFGEKFRKVPLTYDARASDDTKQTDCEQFKRGVVWEIWCSIKNERVWYAEGLDELLDVEEDPLGLQGFWPMAKPLYSFNIPGTMIPKAEYQVYRKQATIVSNLSYKIRELESELKVCGIYNAVSEEVSKLIKAKNGEMIPIVGLPPDANIDQVIAWWPIEKIVEALGALYQARDQEIQKIYEITGIADIVRGSTKASESATAQQLKGNFANLRMQPRVQPMEVYLRDTLEIMAEIMAEHFQAEILTDMTGVEFSEQMMQLLRDENIRNYRIDVETGSTVATDADEDKRRRTEFLEAVTALIANISPLVQQGALPMEVGKELISFGVKGFKIGRELEEAIDQIGAQPAPAQQGPSEAELKQAEQAQSFQHEAQMKAAEMQFEASENDKDRQVEVMKSSAGVRL